MRKVRQVNRKKEKEQRKENGIGRTKRSVLKHFWHCYEREWSGQATTLPRATSTPLSKEDEGRNVRRRRQPRQRPTLHKPRKASGGAGVYSRFGRMEIWDCSILGCAPRRCSVIAEPDFIPSLSRSLFLSLSSSFPSSTTSSSSSSPSFVFPPILTLTYKCVYTCASDRLYLFRSIFSFLLFLPSLCMMRPTRVYLTPRATNGGIEQRTSHFSYLVFFFLFFVPRTTRETALLLQSTSIGVHCSPFCSDNLK